jgi:hypothetical protein
MVSTADTRRLKWSVGRSVQADAFRDPVARPAPPGARSGSPGPASPSIRTAPTGSTTPAATSEGTTATGTRPRGSSSEQNRQNIISLLLQLPASGRTLLLVTYGAEVAAACTRDVYLRDGKVALIGSLGVMSRAGHAR